MSTDATGRPMRADARRNRERVLRAADEVFAAQGTAASTEEVARAAGVGVGTVFRHFPTKEALLQAVLVGRLDRLAREARELAGAPDAAAAFFGFLASVVEQSAVKLAFADMVAAAGVNVGSVATPADEELYEALGALLQRAQRAGAVRPDAGVPEVHALLVGVSHAARLPGWDEAVRNRVLGIVFDGLRPR